MKKALSIICIVLLVAACLSLVACSEKTKNPIDFDKKYIFMTNNAENQYNGDYFVFKSDNTGYYEYSEGHIDFVWKEASDGAVYLFEEDAEHNGEKKQSLPTGGLYFSEEFLVYSDSNSFGSYTRRFIKKGSDLADLYEYGN